MSPDAVGRGNSTALPANCELCASCARVHLWSALAILSECMCSFVFFFAWCSDEESGSLAVVVIPGLLTLSTVSVVALIFYSLRKNKERMQSANAPATHGTPHSPVKVVTHPGHLEVERLRAGGWTSSRSHRRVQLPELNTSTSWFSLPHLDIHKEARTHLS